MRPKISASQKPKSLRRTFPLRKPSPQAPKSLNLKIILSLNHLRLNPTHHLAQMPEIREWHGVQRFILLEEEKGEAHPYCPLLITISLTVVTDELNSLNRLRQHFPKKSKFCFAIAPPPHPKPCLDSQPGSAHSDHLAHSCNVQVETFWHECPMVPFTSCKWQCLGCRLPHPFHWKGNNCHFLPFFLFIHSCLQWAHICQAYGRGWVGFNCRLTGCISSTLWMQLFGRNLETEVERLELWNPA